MKPSETKKNITNIINNYSQEFGIAPQFVEKDYYVVKVLSEISKINYPDLKIIFSGGTCLSKAYHKIQRFSEDIDFRIHTERPLQELKRRLFVILFRMLLIIKKIIISFLNQSKKVTKTTFLVLKLNTKNYMKVLT